MTNPNLPTSLQGIHVPDSLRGLYQSGNRDLTAGVSSMPVLSIRGRAFHIKHAGNEIPLNGPNGYPLQFLDIIILKGSERFSKNYYPNAYVEGSDEAPVCASADGIVPDPGVAQKQNDVCATCRWNVWGSKVTPQGSQVKACSDSRRIAIVPAGAPMNETYGGPMLLRVPPASLGDLQMYGLQLDNVGVPYFAVVTRLSFAPGVAFPKLNFDYSNPVTPDAERAVLHWIGGDGRVAVENILRATAAQGPAMGPGTAAPAAPQQPVTPSTFAGPAVPPQTFQHPAPPPQPQGWTMNPVPGAPPMTIQPQGFQPQQPVYMPPGAPQGFTMQQPQAGAWAPPPPPQQPQQPPPPPPQQETPRRPRGRPRAQVPLDPTAGPTFGAAANAAAPSTPPVSPPPPAASAAPPSANVFQQPQPQPNGPMPETVSAAPADLDAMLNKVLGGGTPST